ncbi:TRADD-N-associated membrane domain-containing protein [Streptosporangium sp. NPDC003464]
MAEGGDVPSMEMHLLKDLGDRLALVEQTITLQRGVDSRLETLVEVPDAPSADDRRARVLGDATLERLASKSFMCAQIAMFTGLALIVFGAVLVPLQPDLLGKVQVGVASGIGAAVTLYIRATFLRIFNKMADEFRLLNELERKRASEDNHWHAVKVILGKADTKGAAALIRALPVPSVEDGGPATAKSP